MEDFFGQASKMQHHIVQQAGQPFIEELFGVANYNLPKPRKYKIILFALHEGALLNRI